MNKDTESSYEMIQYRERLMNQKEFLTEILSKIDKQILALQVERLHLRNTLLGSEGAILPDKSTEKNCQNNESLDNPKKLTEKLDLSITPSLNFEEETEDDL